MAERTRSLSVAIGHFERAQWVIREMPADLFVYSPLTRGQWVRCMDPRYDENSPYQLRGPAIPGGIAGLAFLMETEDLESNFEVRMGRASELIRSSGFEPAIHTDCKLLGALEKGLIKGAHISGERLRRAVETYGIQQSELGGEADPNALLFHDTLNKALLPFRRMYVVNVGYLEILGLDPEVYSPKLVEIGGLVLPPEKREVWTPAIK